MALPTVCSVNIIKANCRANKDASDNRQIFNKLNCQTSTEYPVHSSIPFRTYCSAFFHSIFSNIGMWIIVPNWDSVGWESALKLFLKKTHKLQYQQATRSSISTFNMQRCLNSPPVSSSPGTLRKPSTGWGRNTLSTSLCTTPTAARTTSVACWAPWRRPASTSSQPGWQTAAPASASLARWARTERATSRTAGPLPTVTRTPWPRPSLSPACWTRKHQKTDVSQRRVKEFQVHSPSGENWSCTIKH